MYKLFEVSKPLSSRKGLETLDWLIQAAFEGDPSQSLMANLRNLREEDWTGLPGGTKRSIAEILEHLAWCKWMCEDYAFGLATLQGDCPRFSLLIMSVPGLLKNCLVGLRQTIASGLSRCRTWLMPRN